MALVDGLCASIEKSYMHYYDKTTPLYQRADYLGKSVVSDAHILEWP